MIEYALVSLLESDTGVKSLVDTRIYPIRSPQNATYPNITYFRRGTDRDRTLSGPTGLVKARMQVDCWAKTQKVARQLADSVRLAIDNSLGIKEKGHDIQNIYIADDMDGWEFEIEGKDAIIGRVTLVVEIWHAETVPS